MRHIFQYLFFGWATILPAQQPSTTSADSARVNRLLREARALIEVEQSSLALAKLDTARQLVEQWPRKSSREYAEILFHTGVCHRKKADYPRAFDYLQEALERRSALSGAGHPEVAETHRALGVYYDETRQLEPAGRHYNQALAIYQRQFGPESYEAGTVYSNLGILYGNTGQDPDQAVTFLLKALDIFKKKFGANHFTVMIVYMNLGDAYLKKNDVNQALKHFQYSLNATLKLHGPDHFSVAYNCNNLGEVYRIMGQYTQAIRYFNNAVSVIIKTVGPEHGLLAGAYHNIGVCYLYADEPEKGLEYLVKAFNLRSKILGPDHRELATYYFSLGDAFLKLDEPDKALEHFTKMIELESAPGGNRKYLATAHLSAANAYRQMGRYAQAIGQIDKALALRKELYGAQNPDVAQVLYNLAAIYWEAGDRDNAERQFEETLRALRYSKEGGIPGADAIPMLIFALGFKGRFFFDTYTRHPETSHLYEARQSFIETDRVIGHQHQQLETPGTQYTLAQLAFSMYQTAIATEMMLHRIAGDPASLRKAFEYAEKSKAIVLFKAMQEARALRFAGLPDELLEQEYQFRVDLAYFEKKRQVLLEQGALMTDSVLAAIDVKLFDLNQQYQAFKNRLQFHYPAYYRLRYDLPVSSVQQVQNDLLRPNQTLLEYFVGDTSIFLFVVGKHDFHVEQIKKDFPLEDWVEQFRNHLTQNRSSGASQYADLAHRLYQKLVQPVKHRLDGELIIIPDGVLGYLPFEALLTQKPEKPIRFHGHAYLQNEHRVSYCYSATLLREMIGKTEREIPPGRLLAVAPYFTGDTSLLAGLPAYSDSRKALDPLHHSGEEVYGIQKILGGEVLLGARATEDQFVNRAGRYRVLHLATHGKANDRESDYSFLAFTEQKDSIENELLYVRDIYNLALNAELVTLSACETGIGKLQKGEGVISLARAFAYAGAGSIVTSLWSVNDEQTKDLMLLFYRELQRGKPKNEALQSAKRQLAARPGSHPFYWAGFVAIGDMRPLELRD